MVEVLAHIVRFLLSSAGAVNQASLPIHHDLPLRWFSVSRIDSEPL
jgi:hypothetical protein